MAASANWFATGAGHRKPGMVRQGHRTLRRSTRRAARRHGKQFLRNSHRGRARAYDQLQKSAEAVKDWDRAIELSPPDEQAESCTRRATSRLQAGQVAEAVAEVAD